MNTVCLHFVALHMGVLVASADYIGCYKKTVAWSTTETFASSSHACIVHCCPGYQYAGVSLSECFCGSHIQGNKVDDTECNMTCIDQQYNDSCGSYHTMSVYNAAGVEDVTQTTITSTKPPCFNPSTLEPKRMSESVVWYISVPLIVVILVMVIVCIVMIMRCYKRRRAKWLEISQTMNNSCYRIGLPLRNDDDIEADNGVRASNIRSSADLMGDYDRLKVPEGVIFLDSAAYSHTDPRHLQGTYKVTDNAYSHCNIPASKRRDINAKACGYDNVHFSKSGKVKVGHQLTVQNTDSDHDDSYDKLQNNVLTKPKVQQLNSGAKHVCVKDILKDNRADSEEITVKAKRPHTYDEIDII